MTPIRFLLPVLLAGAALSSCTQPTAPLTAHDAWIRAAPPGASAMAGYVEIENHGEAPVRCTGASGADFGAIEIHRTLIENGQSRMLRDQVVDVPEHGRAALAPGGYHLMLFRPQRPLSAGDRSTLTLHCGAVDLTTEFTVRTN